MRKNLILFVILVAMLSACAVPNPAPAPLETAAQAAVQIPTSTVAVSPSPVPPTETSTATATTQPSATTTSTTTATPKPVDYGPKNFPTDVNPLTGLKVSDLALLNRRPVAVKIQTFPRGQRPPWGLTQTDIVYDYYQNNGLTRLHAIFYGDNAVAGPIRSGRLLDAYLLRMYKSLFAFGFADQRILAKLKSSDIINQLVMEGSSNCPPMCRIDPNTYNFLITDTKKVSDYATSKAINNSRQDLTGMTFALQPPANGVTGTDVTIRYSISAYKWWKYDPATQKYMLSEDAQEAPTAQDEKFTPLLDRNNNQQVSANNVVVLLVNTTKANVSGGGEIIDIKLTGSGTAYAFRDGQKYDVKWNAPQNLPLYLTTADGKAFPFKQGNTWFVVVGQTSKVIDTQKAQGAWRFEFTMP